MGVHTQSHTYTSTHIYTYIHTHIRMHPHTHTLSAMTVIQGEDKDGYISFQSQLVFQTMTVSGG